MLFRNSDGFIIDIKKSDFKNDYIYYSTIMKIKTQTMPQPQSIKSNTKAKPRSKVDIFFDKNCDLELNLNQEPKCNFYSNQAINKLLDEF